MNIEKVVRSAIAAQLAPMQRGIREMRGEDSKQAATARVEQAIASGLLAPRERDWAVSYFAADPTGSRKFLAGRVSAVESKQTAREAEICHNLGASREAFAVHKAAGQGVAFPPKHVGDERQGGEVEQMMAAAIGKMVRSHSKPAALKKAIQAEMAALPDTDNPA